MKISSATILIVILFLLFAISAADDGGYKKYTRGNGAEKLLKLEVDKDQWIVVTYEDGREKDSRVYPITRVRVDEKSISLGGDIQINEDGISLPDRFIDNDRVGTIQIDAGRDNDLTSILILGSEKDKKPYRSRKKGDKISFWNSVIIDKDNFIRGSVVTFVGDLEVYGEVNQDVLSVFGDIIIGEGAVVRGDVIAINGKVKTERGASVYGIIKSEKGKISTRRHRARQWKKSSDDVGVAFRFSYNRVDGAVPLFGLEYEHADSVIPSFGALAGYAFASDRWRYDLSLVQTLIRGKIPVQVGGKIYRLLESDDERLINETENSVFALIINEDWKDYYEAEGAAGFIRVGFFGLNKIEIGYRSEKQNWYDAHANLWSLFGTKTFRDNFSSVDNDSLVAHMDDLEDRQVNSLYLKLTVDTRDGEKHPRRGWYAVAGHEYSPDKWDGDFNFDRFEIMIKRYQPLGRSLAVHLKAAYGRVGGNNIPLNRYFFLGGLGTIHGLRHKEFMGREYVLVSGEYRFRFQSGGIIPYVQYDGGMIAGDRISGDNSWLSSLTLGVDIHQNLKLFISKRLDRSKEDPVFYARFTVVSF